MNVTITAFRPQQCAVMNHWLETEMLVSRERQKNAFKVGDSEVCTKLFLFHINIWSPAGSLVPLRDIFSFKWLYNPYSIWNLAYLDTRIWTEHNSPPSKRKSIKEERRKEPAFLAISKSFRELFSTGKSSFICLTVTDAHNWQTHWSFNWATLCFPRLTLLYERGDWLNWSSFSPPRPLRLHKCWISAMRPALHNPENRWTQRNRVNLAAAGAVPSPRSVTPWAESEDQSPLFTVGIRLA